MRITSLNKDLNEVNDINERASIILVEVLKAIKNNTPIQLEMLDGIEEIVIKKLENETVNISYKADKIDADIKRAYEYFLKRHELWINDKTGIYKARHDAFIIKNFNKDPKHQAASLKLIHKELDNNAKLSGVRTRAYALDLVVDQWRAYSPEERKCIGKYAAHHIKPVSFDEFLEDFKNIFSANKKPFSKIMTRLRHLIALQNAVAYLENDSNVVPCIKVRTLKSVTSNLSSTVSVE
jgi:hypothetical protein